jgi:hypothetical protein
VGRRLLILLVVLVVVGAPAAALRADCAGASCKPSDAAGPAPFCSLPADLRALITAGTYERRSPDVMGVTANTQVTTHVAPGLEVTWPSTNAPADAYEAPLLFIGRDVRTGTWSDAELDRIAPTIAEAMALRRAHPEVRHGRTLDGVVQPGAHTPLVVVIVWKGVGATDVAHGAPWLRSQVARTDPTRQGAGDRVYAVAGGTATVGSLPLDPAAVEATIGSGGLPSQHGITGTWIRNDRGDVARAFGRGAPQPVIAALGDDLDRATDGRALIGLVRGDAGDAGLTGDGWYGTGPVRDRTARAGHDPATVVRSFLSEGWGADATPDLLAVALGPNVRTDDRATAAIVSDVVMSVPTAMVVIAGTGDTEAHNAVTPIHPAATVRIPDGGVAGGYFLDRTAGVGATASTVVDQMHAETGPDGTPMYADAFASYAVRFGRYC